MDVTSSTITIVKSAWTLAVALKRLIHDINRQDESVQELEFKAGFLATIIGEVENAYGPQIGQSHVAHIDPREVHIRETVEKVTKRCKDDLKQFEKELSSILEKKNSGFSGKALTQWRMQMAAPTFERIEISLGEHQRSLQLLVNVLQGRRLDDTYKIMRIVLNAVSPNERMLDRLQTFTPLRRCDTDATLVAPSESTDTEEQLSFTGNNMGIPQQLFLQFFAGLLNEMAAESGASVALKSPNEVSDLVAFEGTPQFRQVSPSSSEAPTSRHSHCEACNEKSGQPSSPMPNPVETASSLSPFPAINYESRGSCSTELSKVRTSRSTSGSSQATTLFQKESRELPRVEDSCCNKQITRPSGSQRLPKRKSHQDLEDGKKLLQAVQNNNIQLFDHILESYSSLEEKDSKAMTPLLLSASLGRAGMLEKLLARGADKTATDNTKMTALHLASQKKATGPIIALLLRYNDQCVKAGHDNIVDVDAKDKCGRTALHYCSREDMHKEAKMLLARTTDIDVQDNGGYSPAYFAIKEHNYFIVKLLLDREARIDFVSPELEKETSHEIRKLLESSKAPPGNLARSRTSEPTVSRHSSVSDLPERKSSRFSSLRRSSTRT